MKKMVCLLFGVAVLIFTESTVLADEIVPDSLVVDDTAQVEPVLFTQMVDTYEMPLKAIPFKAKTFGGHHYEFFCLDSVKTWEDAKEYCENLGGYLAIINSMEENDFLYQLMVEREYKSAYFGITDSYQEGNWIYADGTEPVFTNWHSGEPNSENSYEDYGMFYWKYTDGTWNDGDFGGRTNNGGTTFICEWNN